MAPSAHCAPAPCSAKSPTASAPSGEPSSTPTSAPSSRPLAAVPSAPSKHNPSHPRGNAPRGFNIAERDVSNYHKRHGLHNGVQERSHQRRDRPKRPRYPLILRLTVHSPLAGKTEDALFPEKVPDPGLAITQWRAGIIERHATLDPRIDLARERDKILDRAKMDVWRVVPGAGKVARQRHAAADRHLEPDAPMAEIRKRHDRVPADPQHLFENLARLPCRLQCLR